MGDHPAPVPFGARRIAVGKVAEADVRRRAARSGDEHLDAFAEAVIGLRIVVRVGQGDRPRHRAGGQAALIGIIGLRHAP